MCDHQTHEQDIRIQQYSVVRSAIDSLQEDRNFHSKAYSSWLGAFAAGYGLILTNAAGFLISVEVLLASLLAVSGIIVSVIWTVHNSIYGDDFRARYTVLDEIEEKLPEQPFTKELPLRKNWKKIPKADSAKQSGTDGSSTNDERPKLTVSFLLKWSPLLATTGFSILLYGAVSQPWN